MPDVDACLRHLVTQGGSDLHLKVPSPPLIRLDGELVPIPGMAALSGSDTHEMLRQMLKAPTRLEEFERDREVDFAYAIDGVGRFRVNAFPQRGTASVVCRS